MTDCEVIVVGAGPVGAVAALLLAQAGIDVLLLEAAGGIPEDLRASTLHPPTLDMLDELDLFDSLHSQGLEAPEYRFFNRRSGAMVGFDLRELADFSAHPFRLQCEQWKLARLAAKRMEQTGHGRCRFSHRVLAVEQDQDGVVVHAGTPDGPMRHTARYVIGCDGAGSAVRKSIAVGFDGFTYPEKFLCLSTGFDMASLLPEVCRVNYMADPAEWLVLLQAPTAWRVLVPAAEQADEDMLRSDARAAEVFRRLTGQDVAIETLHRTIYRVQQRVAQRYVDGRILLAGDAAHLNNPLGGLGMNSGIHDAWNLCPRLAAILRGAAPVSQLDRYEHQRRTIMQEIIQAQTIRNKQAMEMSDADGAARQEAELRAIAADPVRRRNYLMSQSLYAARAREQQLA